MALRGAKTWKMRSGVREMLVLTQFLYLKTIHPFGNRGGAAVGEDKEDAIRCVRNAGVEAILIFENNLSSYTNILGDI
jgi:hypothetical protein